MTQPSAPPAGGQALGADTMDLLRFATIGSVDDGKSTLIGRLLFDTRQLFDDQLDAINAASERRGLGEVDLSFVTDGLRAEREQGITIDVAYRYAATPHRKFVIADCPGHIQYTRNMATGASTADLALVLVDATGGLREQTRRHICIAALLGVDQLVVCANKMDLFELGQVGLPGHRRRDGDPVAPPGRGLVHRHPDLGPARRQRGRALRRRPLVRRPHRARRPRVGQRRGLGLPTRAAPGQRRSAAGAVGAAPARRRTQLRRHGQRRPLPHRRPGHRPARGAYSTIKTIETGDGPIPRAEVGLSVAITLHDHIDISRGDLISSLEEQPTVTDQFEATVCWFGEKPLVPGDRLKLKHTTRVTPVIVERIEGTFDVNDLVVAEAAELVENDIGVVRLRTATPLALDDYSVDRITGSFVLIDDLSFATVAAGMAGRPRIHG